MIYFAPSGQGFDLFELLFGRFPSQGDEPSGIPAIEPAVVGDVRTQHDVRLPAGGLGQPDLRPMDAADDDLEKVSPREIVQLLVQREGLAEEPVRARFFPARWG